MSAPLRILHLEDNPIDAELIAATLAAEGLPAEVERVVSRADFEAALARGEMDLILADFSLPDFDGRSALALARSACPDVPFIFVSGALGEEMAIDTLKGGATDYVLKTRLNRLVPAARRALREAEAQRERRRAEVELQQSEARFRQLTEHIRQVFWMIDLRGPRMEYVSPAYEELWGRSCASLYADPRSYLEAVHPEDLPRVLAALERQAQGQATVEEYRVIRPDGTVRWVLDRGFPIPEAMGAVTKVAGIAEDISERKAAAEQLRFQAHLLNVIGQAVILADLQGRVLYWNRAAESLFGWAAGEAQGENVMQFAVPHGARADLEAILGALVTGQSWSGELTLQRRGGERFPAMVHLGPVYDQAEALVGFVGVVNDVTELKRAELAQRVLAEAGRVLASSLDYEKQLQGLARALVPLLADWCAVDVVDSQGSLQRLALCHAGQLDGEQAEVAGALYPPLWEAETGPARVLRSLQPELYPDLDKVLERDPTITDDRRRLLRQLGLRSAIVVPLVARGQPFGVLALATAESGRYFGPADLALAEEVARRGALAGDNARLYAEAQRLNAELEQRVLERMAALLDINAELENEIAERKRAEAELAHSRELLRGLSARLQAAREEERARLAREVHDELGGALTGLKMDLARVRRAVAEADEAALLDRSQAMNDLLDTTIQTVRRIATDLRPGILDDFGLFAALEWQLHDFQTRAGITTSFASEVGEVDVHPACATAIFRVFQEALTNVARHAGATRVDVGLRERDGHLWLEVRDNGQGISENDLFGSRSLGLVGMRERVHLLSGQLEILGRPGQGTTVLVKVPWEVLVAGPAAARSPAGVKPAV